MHSLGARRLCGRALSLRTEANMNKLMNSSMLGLAPIAPSQTRISDGEERPGVEDDEISPPGIERMATHAEIARIRDELDARDSASTKHAHWCSVLLRATWLRVRSMDPGRKIRRS